MSESAPIDYFRRREQVQRALADKAADPKIASIHLDLADQYAARVAAAPPTAFPQMV